MSLRILDDGQHRDLTLSGSVFHWTPCGWGELIETRTAVRDKDTLRVLDGALERRLIMAHVFGWENVEDASGAPIPFSHDAMFELPAWVIDRLVNEILNGVQEEQKEQADLEDSSTTSPTTTEPSRS